jgi:hypothetical protein
MSLANTDTSVSKLDYERVTKGIVKKAKKKARKLERGTTFGIKKKYKDAAFHYQTVAFYLKCKTMSLSNIRYEYTLNGVHHFITI